MLHSQGWVNKIEDFLTKMHNDQTSNIFGQTPATKRKDWQKFGNFHLKKIAPHANHGMLNIYNCFLD